MTRSLLLLSILLLVSYAIITAPPMKKQNNQTQKLQNLIASVGTNQKLDMASVGQQLTLEIQQATMALNIDTVTKIVFIQALINNATAILPLLCALPTINPAILNKNQQNLLQDAFTNTIRPKPGYLNKLATALLQDDPKKRFLTVINTINKQGKSTLAYAIDQQNPDMIKLLLQNKVDTQKVHQSNAIFQNIIEYICNRKISENNTMRNQNDREVWPLLQPLLNAGYPFTPEDELTLQKFVTGDVAKLIEKIREKNITPSIPITASITPVTSAQSTTAPINQTTNQAQTNTASKKDATPPVQTAAPVKPEPIKPEAIPPVTASVNQPAVNPTQTNTAQQS